MKAKSILKGVALCLGLATAVGVITNAYAATPSKNKYLSIYDKNNKQVFYQPVSDLNYVEVAEYQQPQVDPEIPLQIIGSFKMVPVIGGIPYTLKGSYPWERTEKTKQLPDLYYISQFEVTSSDFTSTMGLTKYGSNNIAQMVPPSTTYTSGTYSNATIVDFIEKLNTKYASSLPKGYKFCLPNEWEWEFAATGGKYTHDYIYSGSNDITLVASVSVGGSGNQFVNYDLSGSLPNELGIYNMTATLPELIAHSTYANGKVAIELIGSCGGAGSPYAPSDFTVMSRTSANTTSAIRLCLKKF